jgi:hypothetical protein
MSEDARFRVVYSMLAAQLQMGPVDSADYHRMLDEWRQDGKDADIRDFLFRRAKTAPDLPLQSD